jgi:hypothetical protein
MSNEIIEELEVRLTYMEAMLLEFLGEVAELSEKRHYVSGRIERIESEIEFLKSTIKDRTNPVKEGE